MNKNLFDIYPNYHMSDTDKLLEWFEKNLPKVHYLSDQIAKRASKL
jgi:hypothetical protein